jgi:hypothetical protein
MDSMPCAAVMSPLSKRANTSGKDEAVGARLLEETMSEMKSQQAQAQKAHSKLRV